MNNFFFFLRMRAGRCVNRAGCQRVRAGRSALRNTPRWNTPPPPLPGASLPRGVAVGPARPLGEADLLRGARRVRVRATVRAARRAALRRRRVQTLPQPGRVHLQQGRPTTVADAAVIDPTPRDARIVSDTRYSILDTRYSILDTRYSILDTRYSILALQV